MAKAPKGAVVLFSNAECTFEGGVVTVALTSGAYRAAGAMSLPTAIKLLRLLEISLGQARAGSVAALEERREKR